MSPVEVFLILFGGFSLITFIGVCLGSRPGTWRGLEERAFASLLYGAFCAMVITLVIILLGNS